MSTGARLLAASCLAAQLVLIGCSACRTHVATISPPDDARDAALELFRLAGTPAPDDDALALVIDRDLLARGGAACRLALASLAGASSPRPVAIAPLGGPERAAVDVEAVLPGGAVARFSVEARRQQDGTWRVAWFAGPGVEWPSARPRTGEGLTSSAPPRG